MMPTEPEEWLIVALLIALVGAVIAWLQTLDEQDERRPW